MNVNEVWEFLTSVWRSLSNGDRIDAAIFLVLILTLFYTARGVRLQAKASDFSSYLLLTERLSKAWRAYGDARACSSSSSEQASSQREDFEFLELMNVLEMACHLYNEKIPGCATMDMLRDHLQEVIPEIFKNPIARARIYEARSGRDTFGHIRRFVRNQKIEIEDVPHQ